MTVKISSVSAPVRIGLAVVVGGALLGVYLSIASPAPVRQALHSTPLVGIVVAAPSPSPTLAPVVANNAASGLLTAPSPAPTASPVQVPAPPVDQQFPSDPAALGYPAPAATPAQQQQVSVQAPAAPTAAPAPAPAPAIPATMCTIGVNSVGGVSSNPNPYFDVSTGGYKAAGSLTVVWQAYFQGGFNGAQPSFTWSDGHTGATDSVTYAPGAYKPGISLTCRETYNGVGYAAGSGVGVTITVS